MKKSWKLLGVTGLLAAAAVLPIAGSAAPSAQTSSNFRSAFRVINLGTADAQCSYQLNLDNGNQGFSAALGTVKPGDSAFVYTPSVSGLNPGTYAGTVNCTQPVAAVVNYSDEGDNKSDAYVATDKPAATLYSPSAYNNFFGYNTTLRIQNTSSSSQRVDVAYYAPGAASALTTKQITLAAGGAATVDQTSVTELQPNVPYSAKVSALDGGTLAAIAQITGSGGTANQLYAYTLFSSGATTYYAPVVMADFYGYNTATTVQNIGTAEADVKVTYSNGTVATAKIPVNSNSVFADYTVLKDVPNKGTTLFSSVIESTNGQPLLVTVNESTPATNRATTYEAFSTGGKQFAIPTYMNRFYSYNSNITCQNLGSSATNITASFVGTVNDSTPFSLPEAAVVTNLAPKQSGSIYAPTVSGLQPNFIGSVVLKSTQDIACVVNSDKNEGAPALESKDALAAFPAVKQQ